MKDIIATRRKELGYTQQQLAEKMNVSDKVISKWETGRSLPDTSMLTDLAEVLGISVNELLKSDTVSKTVVKEAFDTETHTKYKNLFTITMALQFIVAIIMAVGRMALEELSQKGDETIGYLVMIFAVIVEIGTITFFTVGRNNLLNKYPKSVEIDRKNINSFLLCTYLLVLAVVIIFVVFHGLEIYEQVIASAFFSVLFIVPFILGYLWNKKRKM